MIGPLVHKMGALESYLDLAKYHKMCITKALLIFNGCRYHTTF